LTLPPPVLPWGATDYLTDCAQALRSPTRCSHRPVIRLPAKVGSISPFESMLNQKDEEEIVSTPSKAKVRGDILESPTPWMKFMESPTPRMNPTLLTPQRRLDVTPQRSSNKNMDVTPKAAQRSPHLPPAGLRNKRDLLQDDLKTALDQGCVELVKLALRSCLSCQQDCTHGNHYLHEAVRQQHSRALEFLLQNDSQKAAAIEEHSNGRTPLQATLDVCVVEDDSGYQMAEMLLQHGAKINTSLSTTTSRSLFSEGDGTPRCTTNLHEAASRGSVATTELLLKYGADPNTTDSEGCTALHTACSQNSCDINLWKRSVIATLLCHGACPLLADKQGKLPRDYTAHNSKARQQLERAEHVKKRQTTTLAFGHSNELRGAGDMNGSCRSREHCFATPELMEAILKFV